MGANKRLADCERRLANLEAGAGGCAALDRYREDRARVLADAGLTPDPWQANVLRSNAPRLALLCARQAGKSTTSAALVLAEALLRPDSLCLLIAPSERQSGELAAKVFGCYDGLGRPVPARKRTELQLHLTNGSRVIALPESEKTIRGYSGARLLVIDEASRVSDALYFSVRPMLAVSGGRLVALSTPFGRLGWFFEAWTGGEEWQRVKITAEQCPRISKEFLAEERRTLGARWFLQEYGCEFSELVGAVFSGEDITAAFQSDIPPLFPQAPAGAAGADDGPDPPFAMGEV